MRQTDEIKSIAAAALGIHADEVQLVGPAPVRLYDLGIADDACGRKIGDDASFRLDFDRGDAGRQNQFFVELWTDGGHIAFWALPDSLEIDHKCRPWRAGEVR